MLSVIVPLLAVCVPPPLEPPVEPVADAYSLLSVGCSPARGECLGEFWLVSLTRDGVEAPAISADPPLLRVSGSFESGALHLSVQTDCNAVSGTFAVDGSQLSRFTIDGTLIYHRWITAALCRVMAQEGSVWDFFDGQPIDVKALPAGGVELVTGTGVLTLQPV
ncbi:MAG: hypothetical protein LBH76_09285 [Propionibacteriaceae bacterium]|nr:hypothetical protein [Propionibacteriaceae bacterium]